MRTNEQFKAYVYEKANAARRQNKRMRTAWMRGTVAFSLLVVVAGVFLYSGVENFVSDSANTEASLAEITDVVYEKSLYPYVDSYSKAADGEAVVDIVLETAAPTELLNDNTNIEITADYSCYAMDEKYVAIENEQLQYMIARSVSEYPGELTSIDFSKNIALVVYAPVKISGWEITYGEESVVVILRRGEAVDISEEYTILLERSKITGKKIELQYR